MPEKITISDFHLEKGTEKNNMQLTYQIFGPPLHSAPVILVNHALTGNSNVTGENGWWNQIIGKNKAIDTSVFTVIAFNIPGNGYDENPDNFQHDYKNGTAKDIAKLFWSGLSFLKVNQLFAVIGGSLGGGIAWEMAAVQPHRVQNLIPIATHWKATDWVIGNVLIQDQILNNSSNPIHDARLHAMFLYRTPESINQKFEKKTDKSAVDFQVENWLLHHGTKLKKRFSLPPYKLMNHLLKTIDITKNSNIETEIQNITANMHIIAVDSDLFFTARENQLTHEKLHAIKSNLFYHEIKSIHGHDAFLIEFQQLTEILKPIFHTHKN
ncbi:alpha/beta fold hydrolase [Flavobacterium sp. SM2513]|uniref:alpha/beta fold hydrolase n=1 Tax=Flavobacterium sp. SM2513 TaxID=3424766 RepID=UPI003D7F77E1